jgi:hypothetical protein
VKTASQQIYAKEIIEEYNRRFQSWGHSDSWGLTKFRMLEDLIYESSKMRINANTLKRFFQQRTVNPQMATNNALCIFLGYAGYADFIVKRIQTPAQTDLPAPASAPASTPAPTQPSWPATGGKQRSRFFRISKMSLYTVLIFAGILFFTIHYWDVLKEKYTNYYISSIVFRSDTMKGASPFTIKINYYIPDRLMNHISVECVEANGDVTIQKLNREQNVFFTTFIYPGASHCRLKYKDKVIRSIDVESRTPGWSTYLKEERADFYLALPFNKVDTTQGYLTLPIEQIPENAISDKLFVSYTYYTDSIIDGDNFIAEARVRNSPKDDNGIPCYDMMMYIFSNKGFHGFALNENCYSYLKFISGEHTIRGDHYDLSRLNFDPSAWHTLRIEVIDRQTAFYLDDEEVLQMQYANPVGAVNEFTLRFKGCGAVDYVKVMNRNRKIVYRKDF